MTTDKDEPSILTTEEAAEYLRLDIETVRRLLRKRKIPGRKVGRSWRIRREDLDRYLSGAEERQTEQ